MKTLLAIIFLGLIVAGPAQADTYDKRLQPFHNKYANNKWTARVAMPEGWTTAPYLNGRVATLARPNGCLLHLYVTYRADPLNRRLRTTVESPVRPLAGDEYDSGTLINARSLTGKRRVAKTGYRALRGRTLPASDWLMWEGSGGYQTTKLFGTKAAFLGVDVTAELDGQTVCEQLDENEVAVAAFNVLDSFQIVR